MPEAPVGRVYLVGGGPGDPGLLTVKGKRLLEKADVVIYDYLVGEELLAHAEQAKLIPARDLHGNRAEQERLNALLIDHARQGKLVVRLKGGDPYLFGRGAEEGQALKAAGIYFEVVPGVTAALAVPAYAGIPVTHRDFASAVAIFTGQVQATKDVDWRQVGGHSTLVFMMAITNLPEVVQQLIAHGRAADTPAAAIQWGTRPEQRTVTAKLRDLATAVQQAELKSPAVVVVGEVVNLRDDLAWYERLPLFGVCVLVTRTRQQSGSFAESLREAGALVYQVPVIETAPPASWSAADAAIEKGGYDWVVFTSTNGVDRFCQRLQDRGRDSRWFGASRLCAIGSETAKSLQAFGLRADLVPDEFVTEAVVAALAPHSPRRVLIPRAAVARDVLPDRLRHGGAEVDVAEVYRTGAPKGAAERIQDVVGHGRVNVVTFTSSSTVSNFMQLAGALPSAIKVACIGPITRRTAEDHGLHVDIEATTYTTAGLKDALVAYYAS